MLEPIPFWGMIEVDLPVKTYAGNTPHYIKEDMNNELVAWMKANGEVSVTQGEAFCIPLYTHPVKDREKDRLRFSDEAFNRWLDEGISDSGHTVYDLVENVCEAWRGWENSQYYIHPVKELTDEEIHNLMDEIEILVHGYIKRAMYRMARKVESILNE